ncbi:MAG: hypothetical protein UT34_C0001G0381 [candidate division WS6 bacterium GW2011_GWF2_39_15]|uniref:DUF916 domain-containing protein n=1 Tax=candidate division WS6 bacterium GW2011_GWF2_39_15 TaxID=1619100 RepID=A0A0G0N0H8_9BACT|nr:MAG: hypothetical protein UT34_C0001G0381 [candidate division WS6 bacterium GW2011_GWF2_39_15]
MTTVHTKILQILTRIFVSALTLSLCFPVNIVLANTLSVGTKEYILTPSDIEFGTLDFTSSDKKNIEMVVSVKSYDPKSESFLDTKPFIGLNKSSYLIKPNETISISYAIAIPAEQPEGTYFNVITIEPKTGINTGSGNTLVSIKNGFGALFAFHIESKNNNIDKIFMDKSDTQLILEDRGIPYISPMKIKYIYENKSNFVFKPQGEIRILDNKGKQVSKRIVINTDAKAIYPGEKIEITEKIWPWSNPKEFFDTRVITARTYNGFTENYLTNQIKVNIKEPLIVLTGITAVLILSLTYTLVAAVKKGSQKRSSTQSSE